MDDNKTNDDGDGRRTANKYKVFIDKTTNLHVHHAILYISLPSLHVWNMKLANFRRSLYGVGEPAQHKSCLFPLLNLDTVLSDSTRENFGNICQIK